MRAILGGRRVASAEMEDLRVSVCFQTISGCQRDGMRLDLSACCGMWASRRRTS